MTFNVFRANAVVAGMMVLCGVVLHSPVTRAKAIALENWEATYPNSLSAHFAGGGGATTAYGCFLCHNANASGKTADNELNAYGNAIRSFFPTPRPTELTDQQRIAAIKAVEALNADGDPAGTTNLEEIQHDTQPGWRTGTNSIYTATGAQGQVIKSVAAPASITGKLDFQIPPTITSPPPMPTGRVGSSYRHTYTATGKPAPTFLVIAGSLPSGLTLNSSSGVMSGTPTTKGTYSGTVASSNGAAPDATQTFVIDVADSVLAPYVYQGSFGAQGSAAGQFNLPIAVAVDYQSANVVVADSSNNRIQIFNSSGGFLKQFGSTGTQNSQFQNLGGMAIDQRNGNIIVADNPPYIEGRVQIFNYQGNFLRAFISTGCWGDELAVDSYNGRIVIVSRSCGGIQVLDAAGVLQFTIEMFYGNDPGEFIYAQGVAIDPVNGNIVVGDRGSYRLQSFSSSGDFRNQVSGFAGPSGIAIDPVSRNIFVSDSDNTAIDRVQVRNSEGSYLGEFGTRGSGNGQFRSPQGVAVNATGSKIYVVDRDNFRVQIFGPPPTVSIGNVSAVEGNTGAKVFNFTVTLSAGSSQQVSVNFSTSNGLAVAGTDYTATSGTLTFSPGTLSRTISVSVIGDTSVEPDETFFVVLSGALNATVGSGQGTGTIVNDDTAPLLQVIEFYNSILDNYFITADPNEVVAVDRGDAGPGWTRTGNTFSSGGESAVCRFYGSLVPGPNSHFYTVDPVECQSLKNIQASTPVTEKRWNFEGNDFLSSRPQGGVCANGKVPVYQAYNNGFLRGVDSNHRITSDLTAIQQVVSRGWIDEGIVMCAPSGTGG